MSRKQEIEDTINRLQVELTKLNRYPEDDPYDDGDVVRFEKGLKTQGYAGRYRRYTFAAIRIAGRWYRTGTAVGVDGVRHAMTWDELVEWLGSNASDLELLAPVTQPQPATTMDSGRPVDTSNDASQPINWMTWTTPSGVLRPDPDGYAAGFSASAILEDLEAIEGWLSHPDGREALIRVLKAAVDATGANPGSRALLVAVDRFLTQHGQ